MDRDGPRTAKLIAAALLLPAALTAATGLETGHLRAEKWLAPGKRAEALAVRPRECLAPPADAEHRRSIAIGRAAFRTPALLGGQAARAGMSCASCHRNGRANPDFQFEGLSGDPGTADVTSSLMSSHRGNGVFDPRPIPDLARPGKVGREAASPALASFVHGLIVEEFDGAEPPREAMAGLLAYLRAIRACAPDADEPIDLSAAIADMGIATAAAAIAMERGDAAAARLMLAGARSMLGDIDERYSLPGLDPLRRALRAADRDLLALQFAVDRGAPRVASRLAQWRLPPALVTGLRRAESRSLYDRAQLTRIFAAR